MYIRPRLLTRFFTVQGYGPFPFDLLRKNGCWPVDVRDSEKLTQGGYRSIDLQTADPSCPNRELWLSHLWLVTNVIDH